MNAQTLFQLAENVNNLVWCGQSNSNRVEFQMTDMCFFNQQVSDCLQHFAFILELIAIYLVCRDYKIRESDLSKKGRTTALTGLPVPHAKRTKDLTFALVIGTIAVCMEFYQLVSQYSGC